MRIVIIDASTTRAAIISEDLEEAGLDDLVAQVEAANPETIAASSTSEAGRWQRRRRYS